MTSHGQHERVELVIEDEDDRYHRQNLISWWDQDRLRDARIMVVGAGALGNELVKNLLLVGVGNIVVCDMDTIENSNLSRCVFFRPDDEGRPKAEVLASRAGEVNPDVSLTAVVGDIRLAVGLSAFADCDVVLGGLDSREARLFVNQACWKTGTPWVDGAIEGLMGVARVFVPPDTSCYECTLGKRDHDLLASRRTCALLTRDEMLAGKVPTTATSSSIVAAIQVQEAVKLLHTDRLGEPVLAGGGFQFVGLTHDSYVVRYPRRDDCLSHDTYDLAGAERMTIDTPFRTFLERAQELLGEDALVELEQEVVTVASCTCGHRETLNRPLVALVQGDGLCPSCGEERRLEMVHAVDHETPELLDLTPADFGLPPGDVLVGRAGLERRFFIAAGEEA